MSKELFISTTPHETKVAIVEEEQLAEIYFERENEYTLAGSIYQGKVTRVLPGMQSAFVDIGLERDAFLYVTDFLEMEDEGDDLETIPQPMAKPAPQRESRESREPRQREESSEGGRGRRRRNGFRSRVSAPEAVIEADLTSEEPHPKLAGEVISETESGDEGGAHRYKGRRRRRGGERREFAQSKFAVEASAAPAVEEIPETPDERAERPRARRDEPRREDPRQARREERFQARRESRSGDAVAGEPMVLPGESLQRYGGTAATEEHATKVSGSAVGRHKPSTEIDLSTFSSFDGISLPGEKLSKYQAGNEPAPKARGMREPAQQDTEQEREEPRQEERATVVSSGAAANMDEPEADASASVKGDPTVMRMYIPAEKGEESTAEEKKSSWFSEEQAQELERIARQAEEERARDEAESQPAARESRQGVLPSEYALDAPEQVREMAEEHEAAESVPQPKEEGDTSELHFAPGEGDIEEIEEEFQDDDFDGIGAAEYAEDEFSIEELEEETLNESADDLRHEDVLAAAAQDILEESESVYTPAQTRDGDGFVLEFDSSGGAEEDEEEGNEGANGATEQRQRSDRGRGRRDDGRLRRGRTQHPSGRKNTQRASLPTISELLKEGQEVLVQIAKEPMAKKGARITSHIALPGRFLVFMPTVSHVGVSRKIGSDEERQRLKRILLSEKGDVHGGFIVRTAAAGASEEDLRADIRFLINLWHEIKARSEGAKPPALIYHDLNLVERVLRDQVTSSFSSIWIDSEGEYERTVRFLSRFQPQLVKRVKLYTKETPLYEQFGIQEEINKALKSKVWLKSGGYIVINQTEALVAIDINTGKYVGKTTRLEDTIVKTNIDAIQEIVRQIRLRDLGGIIVIDFIDMDERRNRQKVMIALEEALKKDRAPSKVLQFNDFGLVAITRKRVKQSLERTLGSVCNTCTGTGFVKSVTTVANEIYVEMRKMAKHLEHHDVMLRVNPEVVKALKANNARWLQDMEELTRKTIIVKSDPTLHQEQFDIH